MKEFVEEDIDSILSNRTHTLVSEAGQKTENWLNKKQKIPKARKSMFTGDSSLEHAQIDVNDPDFWKKVLPDMINPDTMIDRLSSILMEPSSMCNANDYGQGGDGKRQVDANGVVVKKKRGRKPKNQPKIEENQPKIEEIADVDADRNDTTDIDASRDITIDTTTSTTKSDENVELSDTQIEENKVKSEENKVSSEEKAVVLDKFFTDLNVMMDGLKDLHIKGILNILSINIYI
jgi:hypothetical protein